MKERTGASREAEVLSVAALAGWVDSALVGAEDRLFTGTPREDLEEIGQWQRLSDLVFAGQCRAIVACHNRASRSDREFVPDEVGLAINASPTAGASLVSLALAAAALPGLLEAVEAGALTQRHVRAVLRELDLVALFEEQRAAIIMVLLARFTGETPGELVTVLRRLILTVDPDAARSREKVATAGRSVRFRPDIDGQAMIVARGPLLMIAAVEAAVRRTLEREDAARTSAERDLDDRRLEARLFDTFTALLTGGTDGPGSWEAQILVPVATAADGGDVPADVPGYGPVLANTAREHLTDCDTYRRVTIDESTGRTVTVDDAIRRSRPAAAHRGSAFTFKPAIDAGSAQPDGPLPQAAPPLPPELLILLQQMQTEPLTLRDLSSEHYRPSGRLLRYLEARDKTCVFPGCHRRTTDKDHRIPWPLGPTHPDNLACLCRHHHRAKHTSFTLTRLPDGTHQWTSRTGHIWHRPA